MGESIFKSILIYDGKSANGTLVSPPFKIGLLDLIKILFLLLKDNYLSHDRLLRIRPLKFGWLSALTSRDSMEQKREDHLTSILNKRDS